MATDLCFFCCINIKGVAVVPLWDEQGTQIMGMLTASDFILILLQVHIHT